MPQRKPAGRASRFVVAGASVGAGLVLVGGMAAASTAGNQSGDAAEPITTQVVVVPKQQAPTQIVIMLPDATGPVGSQAAGQTEAPVRITTTVPAPVVTAPPAPKAPAAVEGQSGEPAASTSHGS